MFEVLVDVEIQCDMCDFSCGFVINLFLFCYVSLKGGEGNVWCGFSLLYCVDWVFCYVGMLLCVVVEFGYWCWVEDQDGVGGWVYYVLLLGVCIVIVQQDMLELLLKFEENVNVVVCVEVGVIVWLYECIKDWCWVFGGGEKGWVFKIIIWGVDFDEMCD